MSPENHLFIIWDKGRHVQDEILEVIGETLTIVDHYEWYWDSPRDVLRLMYSQIVHDDRADRPFYVVVVEDPDPVYGNRKTPSGIRNLNIKVFDAKWKAREIAGHGFAVHSTDNVKQYEKQIKLCQVR